MAALPSVTGRQPLPDPANYFDAKQLEPCTSSLLSKRILFGYDAFVAEGTQNFYPKIQEKYEEEPGDSDILQGFMA